MKIFSSGPLLMVKLAILLSSIELLQLIRLLLQTSSPPSPMALNETLNYPGCSVGY